MKKLKRTEHTLAMEEANSREHPSEERIRQRAYEIHRARGGGSGQELDDWLQAERELLAEQEHPAVLGGPMMTAGNRGRRLSVAAK